MEKKEKVLFYITITNILLMIIVTIILYANLSKPYLVNENNSNTIIEFYGKSVLGLTLPAISCILLIASIKQKWLCIISFFLSFSFIFVVVWGQILTAALDSFTRPWIGTSGYTPGVGYTILLKLTSISMLLCIIRFIIAIFQHILNKRIMLSKLFETSKTDGAINC